MNHDCAREIMDADGKPTGRWHYTTSNRRTGTYPIGFCSPWKTCPSCDGRAGMFSDGINCDTCQNKGLVAAENPCPGHATPDEACQHYKEYLLNEAKIQGPKSQEWPKEKCDVKDCNCEATHCISIPGQMQAYSVCDVHANKETLAVLLIVGESWHS